MIKDDFIEAEDYYEVGCQWLEEKEYIKAIESFRHVISLNNKFMYAYIDLALCYSKTNRFHEAVQILRKGSHKDPEFHLLYYLMAKYSFRGGDFHGALKSIEKALEYSELKLYKLAYNVIIKRFKQQV
jgi:tetratricopeptide (TPR) repeat protein